MRPRPPGGLRVALAASFVWSLAALAGALALTFVLDGTILTTFWLCRGSLELRSFRRSCVRRWSPSRPSAGPSRGSPRGHDLRRCGLVDGEHDLR